MRGRAPPCGPWGSCCSTWCVATSLSRVMNRFAAQSSDSDTDYLSSAKISSESVSRWHSLLLWRTSQKFSYFNITVQSASADPLQYFLFFLQFWSIYNLWNFLEYFKYTINNIVTPKNERKKNLDDNFNSKCSNYNYLSNCPDKISQGKKYDA